MFHEKFELFLALAPALTTEPQGLKRSQPSELEDNGRGRSIGSFEGTMSGEKSTIGYPYTTNYS
jgi:hypothetical protein